MEWARLLEALCVADLVISTTGSQEPVVTLEQFVRIEPARGQRPLFILDLAVPRDFDPAIGDRPGVYLYSIDDLKQACRQNQRQRDKELPRAMRIIDQETERFLAGRRHRAIGPAVTRLRQGWQKPKEEELRRLLNKLPHLDEQARSEIAESLERLVNKLLHTPLESLRIESSHGAGHALLDALGKLFPIEG
jgi:glutamyl-tRNA reductase